jgi:hypothetical protein
MEAHFKDLVRYVKGELSPDEQVRIERLLLADNESYETAERLFLLHQNGQLQTILDDIKAIREEQSQIKPVVPFYKKYKVHLAIAATLVFALCIGIYNIIKLPEITHSTVANVDSTAKTAKDKLFNQGFHRLSPTKDSLKNDLKDSLK